MLAAGVAVVLLGECRADAARVRAAGAALRLMRQVDPLAPGQRLPLDRSRREVADSRRVQRHARPPRAGAARQRPPRARRPGGGASSHRARAARRARPGADRVCCSSSAQRAQAPASMQASSRRSREATARAALDDVRRHRAPAAPRGTRRPRPGQRAVSLCRRSAEHSGLRVEPDLASELPRARPEAELVVYRVAQESLTNAFATPKRDAVRAVTLDACDGASHCRAR